MAVSTPTVTTLANDDIGPLIIARDQYTADLNDDERKLFDQATLENLLLASVEEHKMHEQKSQSRAIMARLKPLLELPLKSSPRLKARF
jgi:hypothetical protein